MKLSRREHGQDRELRELRDIERKLDRALAFLEKLWAARHVPKPATAIRIVFGPIGDKMADAILHMTDHSVTASLVATDDAGNVVALASIPTWTMGTGGVANMTVSGDGMSATFAPAASGTTTVDVVAEADPTPGTATLHATGNLTVLAAEATKMDLSFGAVS